MRRATRAASSWVYAVALAACMSASARAQRVGHGESALPAVDLVPVLAPRGQPMRINASVGYGYTEDVLEAGDAHHRTETALAFSYAPIEPLRLAARFDARLDSHASERGGDEGAATQLTVLARFEQPIAKTLRAGGEAALRLPGATEPLDTFAAVSPELRAALTWWPGPLTSLSAAAGFRLDRAREGVPDTSQLSLNDRVGLGASDSNALLFGLSATRSVGVIDLLGEWTWDLYVGQDAPAPLESPMRIVAGARWFLTRSLHVQLLAGASPSARPMISADGPLHVIEPRVFVSTGLGGAFGGEPPPKRALPLPPAPPPTPKPTVTEAAPRLYIVTGRVRDGATNLPLKGVLVEIPGLVAIRTDAEGYFQIERVPESAPELRASADGFDTSAVPLELSRTRAAAPYDIVLARDLPEAQIRGTVMSYRGKPVAGLVHVQPGGQSMALRPDGTFELNVAPGEYRVLITARGYVSQERVIRVESGDVTVITVDLRAER